MMKLNKEQMKQAMLRMYSLLCSGTDETDVLDEMGLNSEEFEDIKKAMFDFKATEIKTTPPEHVYIQYIIDQTANIHDLTEVVETYKNTKQPTALVGAIRYRSEILDKIISKGQEFGILRKAPNRTEIVAGVAIADLTDGQLRKQITESIHTMNNLLTKYGNKDILDVSPGPLHLGPGLAEAVLDAEDVGIKVKKLEGVEIKREKVAPKGKLKVKDRD